MRERAAQLVDGAERAIGSAHRELEAGDAEAASERACVAMLRLAKACLDVDGLAPGPTQAVCTEYGRRFGRMYSAYHCWLLDAADLCKASGGDLNLAIDIDSVATVVERTEIFRDAVIRFLERQV
ncbi:MAG: hypothetical protein ABSA21_06890 [Candidatus Limnocylindrales bacterium]|jgi:uncharacterized protein (UPF0332 family)